MTGSANGGSSIGCDEPGYLNPISAQEKLRNRLRLRLNLKYWLGAAMIGTVLLATLFALEPGFIAGVGGVLLMHNRHAKKRHGKAVFLAGDGAYWARPHSVAATATKRADVQRCSARTAPTQITPIPAQ